jgi:hypothetical protein
LDDIKIKSATRRTIFGGNYPQTQCEIRSGISSGEVVWRGLEPLQILERLQTNGTPKDTGGFSFGAGPAAGSLSAGVGAPAVASPGAGGFSFGAGPAAGSLSAGVGAPAASSPGAGGFSFGAGTLVPSSSPTFASIERIVSASLGQLNWNVELPMSSWNNVKEVTDEFEVRLGTIGDKPCGFKFASKITLADLIAVFGPTLLALDVNGQEVCTGMNVLNC